MAENKTNDEGADFRSFDNNTNVSNQQAQVAPALQEIPKSIYFTKRVKIMIAVLLILAIAEVIIYFNSKPITPNAVPTGYRLVTPPNQPSHLEPVK